MLSDRERETLCEIERNLSDEDPTLAETLVNAQWPSARERHYRAYPALMIIAALLTLLALVLGHTTGALACALVAGWAWRAWHRRNMPRIHRSQVTD